MPPLCAVRLLHCAGQGRHVSHALGSSPRSGGGVESCPGSTCHCQVLASEGFHRVVHAHWDLSLLASALVLAAFG